jgi:hypothetical protein
VVLCKLLLRATEKYHSPRFLWPALETPTAALRIIVPVPIYGILFIASRCSSFKDPNNRKEYPKMPCILPMSNILYWCSNFTPLLIDKHKQKIGKFQSNLAMDLVIGNVPQKYQISIYIKYEQVALMILVVCLFVCLSFIFLLTFDWYRELIVLQMGIFIIEIWRAASCYKREKRK